MRYLLIHCVGGQGPAHGDLDRDIAVSLSSWLQETISRGINLGGGRLEPAAHGRCVRVRDGQVLVTDGPFAETKEQVAGYDVIECADLRQAVDVASRHPTARMGAIEIRPLAQHWSGPRKKPRPGVHRGLSGSSGQ